MRKKLLVLIMALSFAFSITACQPQPAFRLISTGTAPLLSTSMPTASPTLAPTFTLTVDARPTPTNIPQPTPAPACFVTKGVPFGFMQDNLHLLYKGDAGIQIIDLQTKQSEEFLPIPSTSGLLGTVVTLSPKRDLMALALTDNSIQVYQTADKKLLHTLTGHTNIITELEFSPDGEKLYSASHDTWVRVWNRSGKQIGAFQPTGADNIPNEVLGMGISADGKMLATIPFDGKTKIWDAEKFTLIRELDAFGGYDNSDAVFSPDGQYLAAITANGLFLWKVSDGTQLMGGNPGINAMALSYSPDGRFLVYWDVQGNNEITFLSSDGSNSILALPTDGMMVWTFIFSPDNTLLVAATNTETRIWRLADGVMLFIGKPACP
jgi:WD40 repeat protein